MINNQIANQLYRPSQVRELDRVAIEERGIPGFELMQRAGRAAFELLLECWPKPEKLHVFCGSGNNAGDGYVIAALAVRQGLPVQVIYLGDPQKLTGDAQLAYGHAIAAGVPCQPFGEDNSLQTGVVVDALLGSGLHGSVREPFGKAIRQINSSQLPVLAVDIPSGLCGDSGAELGLAVQADATVSFIGHKRGLFTGRGPALCGEVFFDSLDVPADIYQSQQPVAQLLEYDRLRQQFPPRRRDAHKGDFGHLMVIGGDSGMGGAVMLAAEAALRCGAGLVSVATRPEHVPALLARRPEVMALGVNSGQELVQHLAKPTVLVIGPGLGQSPWSQQLLQAALGCDLPMLLDADALNLLAQGPLSFSSHNNDRVITPHPGEAARLLGVETAALQKDRFSAAQQLVNQTGAVTVLKGAGTLVCDGENTTICTAGNPGMASGGMGDVLSGVIGALLAQGLAPMDAAQLSVYLHAAAADKVAEQQGELGMIASDLFQPLRDLFNEGTG
ncbi:NAD(P)H-hydrate dehydratase [Porticoccus sp. W117]|uniref:NAD(P)H-hydrate dehydratase n=1 Tax=Porticoccus sp. W117 TaxID=3054777 RepID=UPI00259541FA|nr:NAD(P)H-hydrate dehydratase [Porticoccus sp. W117]MDM3871558.1 NAD(P)H-hydrate dehydratase [Porticoccus sp. W117]